MRTKYPIAPDAVIKEKVFLEGGEKIIEWKVWKVFDHHVVFINKKNIKRSFSNAELFRRGLVDPEDAQNPLMRRHR